MRRGPEAKASRPVTLTADATAKLRLTSTATLTSQLLRRGYRNTFLRGLRATRADLSLVGYAFTLRYVPAREDVAFQVDYDNAADLQRRAVEMIGPGDVLVIDARGQTGAASFGSIIATRIHVRGAAGLVTDGCLRDTAVFSHLDLPSYYRAPHATTSSVLHWAADLNVPVGCADVLVMPGDVVVGDGEGVVVIPAQIAEEVAHEACEQDSVETFALERVQAGDPISMVYPLADAERGRYERWRADRLRTQAETIRSNSHRTSAPPAAS